MFISAPIDDREEHLERARRNNHPLPPNRRGSERHDPGDPRAGARTGPGSRDPHAEQPIAARVEGEFGKRVVKRAEAAMDVADDEVPTGLVDTDVTSAHGWRHTGGLSPSRPQRKDSLAIYRPGWTGRRRSVSTSERSGRVQYGQSVARERDPVHHPRAELGRGKDPELRILDSQNPTPWPTRARPQHANGQLVAVLAPVSVAHVLRIIRHQFTLMWPPTGGQTKHAT